MRAAARVAELILGLVLRAVRFVHFASALRQHTRVRKRRCESLRAMLELKQVS